MSTQLVHTFDRERLRVTRVVLIDKNKSKSRQTTARTKSATGRRHLDHNEAPTCPKLPDTSAPKQRVFQYTSALCNFLLRQQSDSKPTVSKGRKQLRATHASVLTRSGSVPEEAKKRSLTGSIRDHLLTSRRVFLRPKLADTSPPAPCISQSASSANLNPLSLWIRSITGMLKPTRITAQTVIFAGLFYSVLWVCSPDTTRLRDDPASRLSSIYESYLEGEHFYWSNPVEFMWVWFKVEAGLLDNEM
jgi:hypothetical protein